MFFRELIPLLESNKKVYVFVRGSCISSVYEGYNHFPDKLNNLKIEKICCSSSGFFIFLE